MSLATTVTPISAVSDWTCRALVGGLKPATSIGIDFHRREGHWQPHRPNHLRAQHLDDSNAGKFTFVSCQNANQGAQNAFRRMIYEDERARRRNSSALCCISVTSSMRSFGIRKTGHKACTTGGCGT